jgi:hypothetical protein
MRSFPASTSRNSGQKDAKVDFYDEKDDLDRFAAHFLRELASRTLGEVQEMLLVFVHDAQRSLKPENVPGNRRI